MNVTAGGGSRRVDGILTSALAALVLLVPLVTCRRAQDYVMVKMTVAQLLLLFIFVGWVWRCSCNGTVGLDRAGRLLRQVKSFHLAMGTMIILALASAVFSKYRTSSAVELSRLFTGWGVYAATVGILKDERRIRRLVFVWGAASLVTLVIGAGQSLKGLRGAIAVQGLPQNLNPLDFDFYTEGVRYWIESTFGNPNFFASYLVLITPGMAILAMYTAKTRRWGSFSLAVVTLIVVGLLIYATNSQAAYIGLAAGALTLLVVMNLRRRFFVMGIALAVALLAGLFAGRLIEMVPDMRIYFWKAAVRMVLARPLSGFGIGTFFIFYPEYKATEFFRYPRPYDATRHAHSEPLEVGTETGLIGLLVFLWIAVALVRLLLVQIGREGSQGWRLLTVSMVSGIVGFLASDLVGVSLRWPGPFLMFWFAVGLAVSVATRRVDTPGEEPVPAGCPACRPLRLAVSVPALVVSAVLVLQFVLPPLRASIRMRLGRAFYDAGQFEKAAEYYREAILLWPVEVSAHYELAAAYSRSERWEEALEAYGEVAERAPNFAMLHYNLGVVYRGIGDVRRSIDEYTEELRINPYDDEAMNSLGMIYSETGRPEGAVELFRAAVKLRPEQPGYRDNLAVTLLKLGSYEEAERLLAELVKEKPDDPRLRVNLEEARRRRSRSK